jgi:hypothetical protein
VSSASSADCATSRRPIRGEAQRLAFELDEDLFVLEELWKEAAQAERRHPANPEEGE